MVDVPPHTTASLVLTKSVHAPLSALLSKHVAHFEDTLTDYLDGARSQERDFHFHETIETEPMLVEAEWLRSRFSGSRDSPSLIGSDPKAPRMYACSRRDGMVKNE